MVSAAALSRPRVLIVGYRKFGQLMNAVADEFRERADIRVIEHLMGGDEPSGTVLGQEGADVVISAGANAAWLADEARAHHHLETRASCEQELLPRFVDGHVVLLLDLEPR